MTRALEKGREPRKALGGVPPLAARAPGHVRYVVAQYQNEGPKLFCAPLESGEEALLVFSSGVAAQDFLSCCGFGPEWYAMGFSAPGLISLLLGPCADVDWVLLDPFPGCLAGADASENLMHWHHCVDHLLG